MTELTEVRDNDDNPVYTPEHGLKLCRQIVEKSFTPANVLAMFTLTPEATVVLRQLRAEQLMHKLVLAQEDVLADAPVSRETHLALQRADTYAEVYEYLLELSELNLAAKP